MNNLSRDAERQGNNNNNNTTERQSNTTQLARNSHFSKKNWLPRVGLEPTTISSPGDAHVHMTCRQKPSLHSFNWVVTLSFPLTLHFVQCLHTNLVWSIGIFPAHTHIGVQSKPEKWLTAVSGWLALISAVYAKKCGNREASMQQNRR